MPMAESKRRPRKRTKQDVALRLRLEHAAEACRGAAQAADCAEERDALLRTARQYEVAAHLDEWLSSPGLQPPT
jgi:hypothetical protein